MFAVILSNVACPDDIIQLLRNSHKSNATRVVVRRLVRLVIETGILTSKSLAPAFSLVRVIITPFYSHNYTSPSDLVFYVPDETVPRDAIDYPR